MEDGYSILGTTSEIVQKQAKLRPLNIIIDLLFAISSQMLGTTGLKKRAKKDRKWFGHCFSDDVRMFTQLWFVVNGVV